MNGDRLQLPALGCNQFIVWQRRFLSEYVEHQSYTLEAEHVISVGRNLNLELRGFLLAIDNRPFRVRGVFVQFDAEFEA